MGVGWQARGLACALICACGPSVEGNPDAAVTESPDAEIALPSLDGPYFLENVSATPTQMGFHPEAGVLAGGDQWIVWAEVDETNLSDMDIFVAQRQQNLWQSLPLTSDDAVQHTFPSMVVSGNQAFVVWTGRASPTEDLDVFLAIGTDGSWSAPIDLTSLSEGGSPREDVRPEIALSPQGLLVVAYISSTTIGVGEVRVVTASKTGTPSLPQTVTSGVENCTAIDAVASSLGFHVAARCNGGLFYASNESGQWLNQPLAMDVGGAFTPALAVDDDGFVHAAWAESGVGDQGNDDIFHAFREGPGPFSTPRNITQTPDNNDTKPTIAIDPFGRVMIAWQDTDSEDVLMSYADNTLFGPAINLTPASPETRDQSPSIAFDADTGTPIIVIERTFAGSNPLNVDVFALRLAP